MYVLSTNTNTFTLLFFIIKLIIIIVHMYYNGVLFICFLFYIKKPAISSFRQTI